MAEITEAYEVLGDAVQCSEDASTGTDTREIYDTYGQADNKFYTERTPQLSPVQERTKQRSGEEGSRFLLPDGMHSHTETQSCVVAPIHF